MKIKRMGLLAAIVTLAAAITLLMFKHRSTCDGVGTYLLAGKSTTDAPVGALTLRADGQWVCFIGIAAIGGQWSKSGSRILLTSESDTSRKSKPIEATLDDSCNSITVRMPGSEVTMKFEKGKIASNANAGSN